MDTVVVSGGKLTFTISAKELVRGLRSSSKAVRNSEYLVECNGAVGMDGVLQTLDEVTRFATSVVTDPFPFPQIFVFIDRIIVCGLMKIYEWNGSGLDLKYTASTAAGTWDALDFHHFVLLSNGVESVVTGAILGSSYSATLDAPAGIALCNYNGQVFVGAPGAGGLTYNKRMVASSLSTGMTLTGTITLETVGGMQTVDGEYMQNVDGELAETVDG